MNAASWQEVERVLAEILDLPDAERMFRLDTLCATHADLEEQVRSLLAAHNSAGSFLDAPVQISVSAPWKDIANVWEPPRPRFAATGKSPKLGSTGTCKEVLQRELF